ncbi:MAG TPA: class I SAM-dependent methyltransferase [Anaerolineales bacterium]|nr:class I SAM-dependent methyltransferase [Anaerolineales bacterium]
MNFFAYRSVAERYARYRPYFHPLVIEKIKTYLQLQQPVSFAVDVGCGSGHSTVALKEIADFVAGLDLSAEMLAVAERKPAIHYVRSAAERLAIKSNSADLLTTSMAYHWFEPTQFFAEVRRVLQDRAWLVIFNNGFTGKMKESPAFEQWVTEMYEVHFPTPQRNTAPMTAQFAQQHGFIFPYQEEYQNEVEFTIEELVAYLVTQSNVIAATEQGRQNVHDVYDWLIAQARPFFPSRKTTFHFRGFIWYLQKAA